MSLSELWPELLKSPAPANQLPRKSKRSCSVRPPTWFQSHGQFAPGWVILSSPAPALANARADADQVGLTGRARERDAGLLLVCRRVVVAVVIVVARDHGHGAGRAPVRAQRHHHHGVEGAVARARDHRPGDRRHVAEPDVVEHRVDRQAAGVVGDHRVAVGAERVVEESAG